MTELELRKKVISQAESWLGRNEADWSHREIVDIYNSINPLPGGYRVTYFDPWCATFVSAVAQVCELTKWIFPECSCERMIALYKAAGRWMEDDSYRPREGDIIMYDWDDNGVGDNTGVADHVGYVTGLVGDTIHIIEGNCSNAVKRTTRQVNGKHIRGYCLPDYDAAVGGEEQTPAENTPATDTYTVQRGDTLWEIAMRFEMSVYDLAKLNGLSLTDYIYPGQVLRLKVNTTTEPAPDNIYIVQSGDSMWSIAQKMLGKGWRWYRIAEANDIKAPYVIHPGQKLIIPEIE